MSKAIDELVAKIQGTSNATDIVALAKQLVDTGKAEAKVEAEAQAKLVAENQAKLAKVTPKLAEAIRKAIDELGVEKLIGAPVSTLRFTGKGTLDANAVAQENDSVSVNLPVKASRAGSGTGGGTGGGRGKGWLTPAGSPCSLNAGFAAGATAEQVASVKLLDKNAAYQLKMKVAKTAGYKPS